MHTNLWNWAKHTKISVALYMMGSATWNTQQYILYKQWVGNNIDAHNCDCDFIQKY